MFEKKKPDDIEFLAAVINKLNEKLSSFKTRDELVAFLRQENARPQQEHDEEMRAIIWKARKETRG